MLIHRKPLTDEQRLLLRRLRKFTDQQLIELHSQGLSHNDISSRLGISRVALWKRAARLGLKANGKPGPKPKVRTDEEIAEVKQRDADRVKIWQQNHLENMRANSSRYDKQNPGKKGCKGTSSPCWYRLCLWAMDTSRMAGNNSKV